MIEYGPGIPKTLRAVADRMADKIAAISYEGGIANRSGYAYDIMLRYGWCFDASTHIELCDNVRDSIAALRRVSACRCKECVEGME